MKENNIPFVKIRKKQGNQFFKFLKRLKDKKSVLNHHYKVEHEDNFIFFPLNEDSNQLNELFKRLEKSDFNFQKIYKQGIKNEKFKFKNLEAALQDRIPEPYFKYIPQSYDIIGSIAIVEIKSLQGQSEELPSDIKRAISKAITQVNKNVKSVYEKKSEIKGEYRLRSFNHLYGDQNTETIYKENHCSFKLDIRNTFFTPRLVYERRRVSNLAYKDSETIVDLFAGVGPFSIQIARKNDVKIYAFDKNPEAIKFLKDNISLNSLRGTINAYNIDVRDLTDPNNKIGKRLRNQINRIIMNLPERSLEFIDIACSLLKPRGGILHNYQFAQKSNPLEIAEKGLRATLKKLDWEIEETILKKIVKPYSPKMDLVVIDAILKKRP